MEEFQVQACFQLLEAFVVSAVCMASITERLGANFAHRNGVLEEILAPKTGREWGRITAVSLAKFATDSLELKISILICSEGEGGGKV